jgi:hypothetical protein
MLKSLIITGYRLCFVVGLMGQDIGIFGAASIFAELLTLSKPRHLVGRPNFAMILSQVYVAKAIYMRT